MVLKLRKGSVLLRLLAMDGMKNSKEECQFPYNKGPIAVSYLHGHWGKLYPQ